MLYDASIILDVKEVHEFQIWMLYLIPGFLMQPVSFPTAIAAVMTYIYSIDNLYYRQHIQNLNHPGFHNVGEAQSVMLLCGPRSVVSGQL